MAVVPYFAFPLIITPDGAGTVEKDEAAHVLGRAEVVLRTRPGTLEYDPEMGLADQVGEMLPVAGSISEALRRYVSTDFLVAEDLSELEQRTARVQVSLSEEA